MLNNVLDLRNTNYNNILTTLKTNSKQFSWIGFLILEGQRIDQKNKEENNFFYVNIERTKLTHVSIISIRTHTNETTLWNNITWTTIEAYILLTWCDNLLNDRWYDGGIGRRNLNVFRKYLSRRFSLNCCDCFWCAYSLLVFFLWGRWI